MTVDKYHENMLSCLYKDIVNYQSILYNIHTPLNIAKKLLQIQQKKEV